MGVSGSIISGDNLRINVGPDRVCRGIVTKYDAEQIVHTVGVVFVDLGDPVPDPDQAALRRVMVDGIGGALRVSYLSVVVPQRWSELWCEEDIQRSPGGAFIQKIGTDFFGDRTVWCSNGLTAYLYFVHTGVDPDEVHTRADLD